MSGSSVFRDEAPKKPIGIKKEQNKFMITIVQIMYFPNLPVKTD
jgi:hypothetical protein